MTRCKAFTFLFLMAFLLMASHVFASGGGNKGGDIFNNYGGHGGTGLGVGIGVGVGQGGGGGNSSANTSFNVPRQYRFANMAYAPSIQPSSDCRNPFSIGGAGPLAGLSTGWTYEDVQCRVTETMRVIGSLKMYGVYSEEDADGLIKHATCKLEVLADSPYCDAHRAATKPAALPENVAKPVNPDPEPEEEAEVAVNNGPERELDLSGLNPFTWFN